jgi:hypothetical protein
LGPTSAAFGSAVTNEETGLLAPPGNAPALVTAVRGSSPTLDWRAPWPAPAAIMRRDPSASGGSRTTSIACTVGCWRVAAFAAT